MSKALQLSIGFWFWFGSMAPLQASSIDSLLVALERSDEVARMAVLNALANEYQRYNLDSAHHYQMQALFLAQHLNNQKEEAYSLNILGEIYLQRSEFQQSLAYFRLAHNKAIEANSIIEQGTSINNIAALFAEIGNHNKATEYYQKALEIFLAHGNHWDKAIAYNNLGSQYIYKRQYTTALDLLQKGLEYAQKVPDKQVHALLLGNRATCYNELHAYDQALANYQQALEYQQSINDQHGMITTLMNMAYIWLDRQKYPNALMLVQRTEPFDASLQQQANRQLLLARIADSLGNYRDATRYLDRHRLLQDSLRKLEKFEILQRLTIDVEHELNKKQNLSLKGQIEKEKRANLLQRYLVAALVLLLVVVGWLSAKTYRQYKVKQHRNVQLQDQNLQIRQQNQLLTDQGLEIQQQKEHLSTLIDKMRQLDRFRKDMNSMLVHDLKNPLNAIIGISALQLEENPVRDDNWVQVNTSGHQMLRLVNNILDLERFEEAKIQLDNQRIDVKSLIDTAKRQLWHLLDQKQLAWHDRVPVGLHLWADPVITERILINLLSNAIKYTPAQGSIYVGAQVENSQLARIEVRDTGPGVPPQLLDKVFERYAQFAQDTEQMRSSTGLGLTFVKMAVEAHGGNVGVLSPVGQGATFWFTLPIVRHES